MLNLFGIPLVIDGKRIKVRRGVTILEAARQAGIDIPSLCHMQGHPATGVCRVCVVEVEGARTLVGSCHTPVSEGMVIHTRTPRVLAARRAVVELMLAAHTGDCVNDPNADHCGLHRLASDHEVGAPRFRMPAPRFYPVEDDNPYVRRDLSKCILCRKCITACNEVAGRTSCPSAIADSNRRSSRAMTTRLATEECRDCGVCIEHCPTGALSRPRQAPQTPEKRCAVTPRRPGKDGGRAGLLPILEEEVAAGKCLSREVMEAAAGKTGLSLSDVYGVASFYSFLPRDGKAKHTHTDLPMRCPAR